MAKSSFVYIENPNSGHDERVYFEEVEDIASIEDNDNTKASDMDDNTFMYYAEIVLDRRHNS